MVQAGTDERRSHRRLPRARSRVHATRSLAVALVALGITTLSALPRGVSAAEEALFDAVNGLPGVLEWPLWLMMQFGAVFAVPMAVLAASLVWRRLRPALDLAVAGAVAWLAARIMKEMLGRGRPAAFFDDVDLRGALGVGGDQGLGFPSGHTTLAFAMAIVVFPYLSVGKRVAAALLAAAVGLTRMYFGAHLPLDILGGAALGVAIAASVHLLMDLLTHRH